MSARFIAAMVGALGGLVVGATLVAPKLTPALDAARTAAQQTPPKTATSAATTHQPPGSEHAVETSVWRVSSALPRSRPAVAAIADALERDLSHLSGGTLQVTVSEPGHLVTLEDTLAAVQSGAIDAVLTPPGLEAIGSPNEHHAAIALFAGHPFGLGPLETVAWLGPGGGTERLNTLFKSNGLHAIPCGLSAAASGGWFVAPLANQQFFAGKSISASGFAAMVLDKLGADVMPLNSQETAQTFAAGGLDGAVLASPYTAAQLEFEKYVNALLFPAWHQPASIQVLAINSEKWAGLEESAQSALVGLCQSMMLSTLGQSEAAQFDALKSLMARGVDVYSYSAETMTALRGGWSAVTEELINEDRSFRVVWAELQAFRETYAIWNDIRTADGAFESQ